MGFYFQMSFVLHVCAFLECKSSRLKCGRENPSSNKYNLILFLPECLLVLGLEFRRRVQSVPHPRLHRDLHFGVEPGAPAALDATLLHQNDVVRVLAAGDHCHGGHLQSAHYVGAFQLAVGQPQQQLLLRPLRQEDVRPFRLENFFISDSDVYVFLYWKNSFAMLY